MQDAFRCIGEAISQEESKLSRAGRLASGQRRIAVGQILERGFREHLQHMTRFVIDVKKNSQPDIKEMVLETACVLGSKLLEQWKFSLYENPAFSLNLKAKDQLDEGLSRLKSKLNEISQLNVEDMQNGIIGYTRHESVRDKELSNIIVVDSPGAMVQQGRDNLQKINLSWDAESLASVLNEVKQFLENASLSQEDLGDLKAQIASMQAQLGARNKDMPFLQKTGVFIADFLKKIGSSGAVELGKRLIDCLPLVL